MGIQNSDKIPMTKDLLMKYTLLALFAIAFLSYFAWGLPSLVISLISVGVAVGCDFLLSMVMGSKGSKNTMSAAVFGLIVAMSYSLGLPIMAMENLPPLSGGFEQYLYPALISAVGLVVFKKLQGLTGRKYVNPAAVAKLLVLGLLFLPAISSMSALTPSDHTISIDLQNSLTPDAFGGPDYYPMDTTIFGSILVTCYGNPSTVMTTLYTYGSFENPLPDVLFSMIFLKYHGWIGGFSSIIVMAIGLLLFAVCRRYIKWRITLSYLVATVLFAGVMGFIYGGDPILRIIFHLFIGSSIFLAFFMATDPATTPITHTGQLIFGIGLGVLTILIQVYTGFLGGSILALVIMNLTSPVLDNVGKLRQQRKKIEAKLPDAKHDATFMTYDCMRCGACMNVCVNALSPILIKQAHDKQDANKLMKLNAEYCTGCGNCNFVCPARIDLESYTLGYNMSTKDGKEIEQKFLNGTEDENIGVYTKIFSAKGSVDGQDGGVVTDLLLSGMQNDIFDSAIVVKRTDGYWAEAVVAENIDDVKEAKGTKYIRVNMMAKLKDLIAKGKRKIAIVGTACQVRAIRRLQKILLKKYANLELTIIGLFCYEIFDYQKLKEETKRLLDVDLDLAEKTQIQKGQYIVQIDGKEHSVSVKELNAAVEKRCINCPDFTAIYSDISVGSVGSPDGYSTVIVRSDVGKKLLQKLDLAKGEVDKEEVTKLSILKKKRAQKNMAA